MSDLIYNIESEYGRSREYVIQKLDKWCEGKFAVYYTPELAADLGCFVREWCTKADIPADVRDDTLTFIKYLYPDRIIKEASSMFSVMYFVIESIVEGSSFERDTLDYFESHERQDYLDPLLEVFSHLQKFVNALRKYVNQDYTVDLSDEVIDKYFVSELGGMEGFSNLATTGLSMLSLPAEYNYIYGIFDEYPEWLTSFTDMLSELYERMNEVIFADLSINGEQPKEN